MGEVYKARDTRLGRDVALKILPLHVADDPDRRERFKREAHTISSLNHPHICTLFDVGEQDGVSYLVMELLEGETLADQLRRGALPMDQALAFAMEIAGALDRAHRRGHASRSSVEDSYGCTISPRAPSNRCRALWGRRRSFHSGRRTAASLRTFKPES